LINNDFNPKPFISCQNSYTLLSHFSEPDRSIINRSAKSVDLKKIYHKVSYFFLCFIATTSLLFAKNITVIPDVKLKSISKHTSKIRLSSTSYTKSEITKSPVINLSEFLNQEQSVVRLANNSGDTSQTALSLRGFGDNAAANSLILVDGFPLINSSLLAPNFNSIPLSDIERIEISQGSEGSLWGNQAVGGVVNIITKHPKKFNFNSIISTGSYNSHYDNIFIANKS
jgi:outer membrane receptor for ferrienterochelin and colicin